jgi:hypothetical protein
VIHRRCSPWLQNSDLSTRFPPSSLLLLHLLLPVHPIFAVQAFVCHSRLPCPCVRPGLAFSEPAAHETCQSSSPLINDVLRLLLYYPSAWFRHLRFFSSSRFRVVANSAFPSLLVLILALALAPAFALKLALPFALVAHLVDATVCNLWLVLVDRTAVSAVVLTTSRPCPSFKLTLSTAILSRLTLSLLMSSCHLPPGCAAFRKSLFAPIFAKAQSQTAHGLAPLLLRTTMMTTPQHRTGQN